MRYILLIENGQGQHLVNMDDMSDVSIDSRSIVVTMKNDSIRRYPNPTRHEFLMIDALLETMANKKKQVEPVKKAGRPPKQEDQAA